MNKQLVAVSVVLAFGLTGCDGPMWYDHSDVEDYESEVDPRMVEKAHELCEDKGGVYDYDTLGSDRVVCFNTEVYFIRSGEKWND